VNAARPQIRLTVAAVLERAGRCLYVEEAVGGRRVFNQPAGHHEPGESLPEAVVRELREETGYACRAEALVGVYLWSPPAEPAFLRFAFACTILGGDGRPEDPDILATHWLTHAELAGRELRSPLVMRTLEDYVAGRRYPLELMAYLGASP
jgi:8-oxo-dGTP pyrophosphatase MutT (NUDIX family)